MNLWTKLFGTQQGAQNPNVKQYTNKKWGFELRYPENWEVLWENEPADSWTTAVCIAGPSTTGGRPALIVNARKGPVIASEAFPASGVSVFTLSTSGQRSDLPKTIKQYIDQAQRDLASSFQNFKPISSKQTEFVGGPAVRIDYSYDGDSGKIQEFCLTRFGVMTTFQITGEAPAANAKTDSSHFDRILKSFTLLS